MIIAPMPKNRKQCYWYGKCECNDVLWDDLVVCDHYEPLDADDEYDEDSIEELVVQDYEWFCEDWEIYVHQYD